MGPDIYRAKLDFSMHLWQLERENNIDVSDSKYLGTQASMAHFQQALGQGGLPLPRHEEKVD
jgi:hypothetical protein